MSFERNIEHYKDDLSRIADKASSYEDGVIEWIKFALAKGMHFGSADRMVVLLQWMLDTYRPIYKLSKFEFDLLDSMPDEEFSFYNCIELIEMQRKGYFKEIPSDAKIKDILAKGEVKK